jgi:flavin-dependent dehydrogenase
VSYRLQFTIQGVPELARALSSQHWRDQNRHAHFWRSEVVRAVGSCGPPEPLQKAEVTIEMWRKGNEPDPDNLAFSAKPLLDGLQPGGFWMRKGGVVARVGCGVLANDRKENFEGGRAEVIWHRCLKNEKPRTVITVKEVER